MQINKDMLIGELVVMDELIPQMLMGVPSGNPPDGYAGGSPPHGSSGAPCQRH